MKNLVISPRIKLFVVVSLVVAVGLYHVPFVRANTSQQINDLQAQIDAVQHDSHEKRQSQGVLSVEASSLNEAIDKLQTQMNASQSRINALNGEISKLNGEITAAEAELEKQKDILGQTIKAMYVEGDISTLEMLASSNSLSNFVDKQQYRESVRTKVKNALDTVNRLKAELTIKRDTVKATLAEQQSLRDQIAGQKAEKDRILALNQAERNKLENQIKANSGKIAELKRKQAEAEAALARSLSNGSYRVASVGPVAAGEVVGAIGNTGLSSGPHLHLEVRIGSSLVNPAPYIRSQPVNQPPAWVSQGYGVANPLYRSGYHRGIDYATSKGSPIFAIDGGQMYRGCSNQMLGTRNNDYGYVAIVEHANGAKSIYAHMSGGPSSCNYNTYY